MQCDEEIEKNAILTNTGNFICSFFKYYRRIEIDLGLNLKTMKRVLNLTFSDFFSTQVF